MFENLSKKLPFIEFHEGLCDLDKFSPSTNNLVVLDVLMSESEESQEILKCWQGGRKQQQKQNHREKERDFK